MDTNLTDTAINLALKCKWIEAIEVNKKILKIDPDDIDALNRLARCYCELGKIKLAKETSLKICKLDPNNSIANKALEKYKKFNVGENKIREDQNALASDFIEEPGTTKQTHLINLSSGNTISSLDSGDEVKMIPNGHRVAITTKDDKYIGRLPDDMSAVLKKLLKHNYKYKVLIKSASKDSVKIFIKEIKRGLGCEHVKSFPQDMSESFSEFTS